MPWTIERLRRGIVALAVLLLLTIAGAFFYGRWRLRHLTQDLPAKLGIQIQQSTQGFVLSKTEQGRTIFTLHAARAIEFKSGGQVGLHHVEIDVYNRQTGVPDTIAGDDFEYDRQTELVESKGEAHIVLHGPASRGQKGKPSQLAGQTVQVTTHGLTFNQKTGVAVSSGEVDFQVGDSSGRAVGAEFDSKQGHLSLESNVLLTTRVQSGPAMLRAARAVYDRRFGEIRMWQPRYKSTTQSGTAATANVILRGNGSAQRLEARGGVRLASAGGAQVRAAAMKVLLGERSQPTVAYFSGGVQFGQDGVAQQMSGKAGSTEIDFDARGRAKQVVLDQAVQGKQRVVRGKQRWQRAIAANHLVLDLHPAKSGNAQMQAAQASGDAVFTEADVVPGHAPRRTTVAGQSLHAEFSADNRVRAIEGRGQTRLETVSANGDVDSSTGDTLQIEFSAKAAQSVQSAVQTGHVVMRQTSGGKNSAARNSLATARRADYAATSDTLTLTGDPTWSDAQLRMTADRMELKRTAGVMVATGAVQTTLLPKHRASATSRGAGGLLDGRQAVHIIAEKARISQANRTAVFSGRARLWQGEDAVEAPTIELSQKARTLKAYGRPACADCVLGSFAGDTAAVGVANGKRVLAPSFFRIRSGWLDYSDRKREAIFRHGVQVVGAGGVLDAEQAEIFLTPVGQMKKTENPGADRNQNMSSTVTKMVATGNVRLTEPGRSATGSRLVYTAADGHFVLTGDVKNPPEVVDLGRGTITGQMLTFGSREQAIMVSGTPENRAETRTRVQKK